MGIQTLSFTIYTVEQKLNVIKSQKKTFFPQVVFYAYLYLLMLILMLLLGEGFLKNFFKIKDILLLNWCCSEDNLPRQGTMENPIYQLNNKIFWEIEIYRNRNVIKGDSFTADRISWLGPCDNLA